MSEHHWGFVVYSTEGKEEAEALQNRVENELLNSHFEGWEVGELKLIEIKEDDDE